MPTATDRADLRQLRAALVRQARGVTARAGGGRLSGEDARLVARLLDAADDARAALDATPPDAAAARRASPGYAAGFDAYLRTGTVSADLQLDIGEKGGYLASPQFVAELAGRIDSVCWFRRLARVLPPTVAPALEMPRRLTTLTPFGWAAEVAAPAADAGLSAGRYRLTPHWLAGLVTVSGALVGSLRVPAPFADAVVRGQLAIAAAEAEETAFLTGDGTNRPLGLFARSDAGVPVGRDVSGTITTAAPFLAAKYSLRAAHLESDSLRWVMHRNAAKALCTVTGGTGQPLWHLSERDGEPDRFLGIAVAVSEFAPQGTGANGTYQAGDDVAALGDLAWYDVADGAEVAVYVLRDGPQALANQVHYLLRRKVDGCPRDAEAFARVVAA
jgi:HK97 family phage major capsid protein